MDKQSPKQILDSEVDWSEECETCGETCCVCPVEKCIGCGERATVGGLCAKCSDAVDLSDSAVCPVLRWTPEARLLADVTTGRAAR